ncbi:hypothetical protein WN55_01149 [Dufourea novaeangliae]|uniref:Uncharacterized protein n=1 Tax=Dufourea novaeangliae TaxID=178035 RepID=A0A154PE68_DUFNO|nr:hypothetical protein WN55_01149 [Dufourea novaeangliae]
MRMDLGVNSRRVYRALARRKQRKRQEFHAGVGRNRRDERSRMFSVKRAREMSSNTCNGASDGWRKEEGSGLENGLPKA